MVTLRCIRRTKCLKAYGRLVAGSEVRPLFLVGLSLHGCPDTKLGTECCLVGTRLSDLSFTPDKPLFYTDKENLPSRLRLPDESS